MKTEFTVIIEKDPEGYLVASVPELKGCHTQARSFDQLNERIKEAIELCLLDRDDAIDQNTFIGIQRIAV
jgi:predicted RNase H-like HicB family nuclease